MKYVAFGIAAALLGILASWFGLAAVCFAIGHLWADALIYSVLTAASSGLSCVYSGLFVIEWLKDLKELP